MKKEPETYNEIKNYLILTMNELFSIELAPGESKMVQFEIVLPNVGTGGFKNMLYAD